MHKALRTAFGFMMNYHGIRLINDTLAQFPYFEAKIHIFVAITVMFVEFACLKEQSFTDEKTGRRKRFQESPFPAGGRQNGRQASPGLCPWGVPDLAERATEKSSMLRWAVEMRGWAT